MPAHTPPARLRDVWIALAGLSAVFLFEMLDNSVLTVALPTIGRDLSASTTSLQWVSGAYSVAFGGLMLLFGSVADRFGRRRTMLTGLVLVSPYAAPARAEDLSGLPRTYVDCGSAEVFRDETVAWASALWAAGVDAELHVWPGAFHGFTSMEPGAAVSRSATDALADWTTRLLGPPTPVTQPA